MSNTNYSQSFEGIIDALTDVIFTVSGVGTTSFTLSSQGYPSNFAGVVQAITDLNYTLSGVTGGGGGGGTPIAAGSGIYLTTSGAVSIINSAITSASGTVFSAGSGLYLVNSTEFNINYDSVFQNSVSGHVLAAGSNTVLSSGNVLTVSGTDISSVRTYVAAESIASGQPVTFDAGALVVASAASGVSSSRHNVFGFAVDAAAASGTVTINSDNIVTVYGSNITADAQLTPGDSYYLSKFSGQLTKYTTTSGAISLADGYGALVYVGRALSQNQLEVEIQPKIILTE
jgi:hypothetical protein